jgi:hypothetical protein
MQATMKSPKLGTVLDRTVFLCLEGLDLPIAFTTSQRPPEFFRTAQPIEKQLWGST